MDSRSAPTRLGAHMEARRTELRLTWTGLARLSGLSRDGIHRLRFEPITKASQIRPLTKRAIEDALNWAPGSVDEILRGGDPTPVIPGRGHGTLPAFQGKATGSVDQPATIASLARDDPKIRAIVDSPYFSDKEKVRMVRELLNSRLESEPETGDDAARDAG